MNLLVRAMILALGAGLTLFLVPHPANLRIPWFLLQGRERLLRPLKDLCLPVSTSVVIAVLMGLPMTLALLGWIRIGRFGLILGVLAGSLLGLLLPRGLHAWQRRRVEEQLPDALHLLAGGLRTGLSLSAALEEISPELPLPLQGLMRRVLREARLGSSLEDALQRSARRTGSSALLGLASTIRVLRPRGGNLALHFRRVATSLRDRRHLEDRIRTLTTGSRTQGIVSGLLPVFFFALFALWSPEQVRLLLSLPPCRWLLIFAAILDLLGLLLILRLSRIPVV